MAENINIMTKILESQQITEKNSNSSTKSIKLIKNPSVNESINSRKRLQNKSNLSADKPLESIKNESKYVNRNIELKDTINFQLQRL